LASQNLAYHRRDFNSVRWRVSREIQSSRNAPVRRTSPAHFALDQWICLLFQIEGSAEKIC